MEGNAQRVKCSLCSFAFATPQHFDAHNCPVLKKTQCTCGKEFIKKADFVAHFGGQHVSGNQCLVCMETVNVESEKNEHWLSHGEEEIVQRQMIILAPEPAAATATVTANPTSDLQRMLDQFMHDGHMSSESATRVQNHVEAEHIPQQQMFIDDGPSTSRQMQSSSNIQEPIISCKRARLEIPEHPNPPQPSPQCHMQPGPSTQQHQPIPQFFLVPQAGPSSQLPPSLPNHFSLQQHGPSTQLQQQPQPPAYLPATTPPFRPMFNSPSYPQGMMQFPPQYQISQAPTPFHPSVKQYLTQMRGAPNCTMQNPQLQHLLQGFPSNQQAFPPQQLIMPQPQSFPVQQQQQQRMPQSAVPPPWSHPQFVGFTEQGQPVLDPRINPQTHPHLFLQQPQLPQPQPAPPRRTQTRKARQPKPLPQQPQAMPGPFPNTTMHNVQGVPQQVIVPPPPYSRLQYQQWLAHQDPPAQVVPLLRTIPPSVPVPAPTSPPPPVIQPHSTILERLLITDSDEEVTVQPAERAAVAVSGESSMPHLVPEPPIDSLQMPSTSSVRIASRSPALQDAAADDAPILQPPAEAAVDHSEDPAEEAAMDVPTAPALHQPPTALDPHLTEPVDAATSPPSTEAADVTLQPPTETLLQPVDALPTENLPEKLARIKEEVADDVTLHGVDASSLIGTLSAFLQSPADLASLGASEAASIDDLFKRYELLKKQAAGATDAKDEGPGPSTSTAQVKKEPSPEVFNSSNTVSVATGADDETTDDVKDLKEEDKAEVTVVAYPPYQEEEEMENLDDVQDNDELEDGEVLDDSPAATAAASHSRPHSPPSQADPLVEDPVDNVENEERVSEQPAKPSEPAIVAPAASEEPVVVLKTVEPRRVASTTTSLLKPVKVEVDVEQPVQPTPAVEPMQPGQQPAVDDVIDEPIVVRTPSRTPSRTPVRTRKKSVKREEIDEDEDMDDYAPSTSTRPIRRRSVKKEYWEEMDVKPSAYDLVKSCSRSCRIKEEPMDDDDINHQRFLRCDSEYSHCPECGDEVGRLTMGRRMHYRRVHYPIFFRLEKGMGDIERWVSSRIGAFSGTPATEKDGRICLMCNDVNELHNGRMPLLKHIQQVHKAEYKQLKEDYRLYSREKQRKPEDLDVHRKLL